MTYLKSKINILHQYFFYFNQHFSLQQEYRENKLLKKAQNNKIANVEGSVWLSLFMDGSGNCKLSSN